MNAQSRITIDPEICQGKPTIRNLRCPVSMILDLLASDMTASEILADYEDLEPADIQACLLYASRLCDVPKLELEDEGIHLRFS